LLNRANFAAACLVQLSNKTCQEEFPSLNAMHNHMKKTTKKKRIKEKQSKAVKRVNTRMTMNKKTKATTSSD
jgi:hypothetical protein